MKQWWFIEWYLYRLKRLALASLPFVWVIVVAMPWLTLARGGFPDASPDFPRILIIFLGFQFDLLTQASQSDRLESESWLWELLVTFNTLLCLYKSQLPHCKRVIILSTVYSHCEVEWIDTWCEGHRVWHMVMPKEILAISAEIKQWMHFLLMPGIHTHTHIHIYIYN